MNLHDFVVIEAANPDLQAAEPAQAIEELIGGLVATGAVPADLHEELTRAILDRERHGSTGFGKGVAVPHAKHDRLEKMVAAIGISRDGVKFNALDKAPVHVIFLLISPRNKPDEHLQAMERIVSNLQKDTFRRFLRQATTREQIEELLQEADSLSLET